MPIDNDRVLIVGAGQSGLASAHAALEHGLRPVLLEASRRAAGSWPRYYDSLTLFSPARYSSLPGMGFDGDPERYPRRDEVGSYLERYAVALIERGAELRTGARVSAAEAGRQGFTVRLEGGEQLSAGALIAASGSFGRPHRPALPGLDTFTGPVLHVADYHSPTSLPGEHVIVVGAGNSAVQVAHELASQRRVTLASRVPIRFVAQRPLGRDLHFWFRVTGFDRLPPARAEAPPASPVLDDGRYRRALREGRYRRRPIFARLDGDQATWPDGSRERVDAVLLATGYRPNLAYLERLGVLGADGRPRQRHGLSLMHVGLGYLGLEWQRTPSSNTLRGVGADARHVMGVLARQLRGTRQRTRA
ncbi:MULTISPECIES: flavin-containing monooxygenase [Streptosporangium]|uniref:Flavoprotein involved in K+ transport n=1 Tax=Streptosporangium brasiliense TaxID=47480 RepID=A0ABT9RHI7_9ACTN|nr:NAD(P)/FAD-dependent oxidoreductase [Streptosporangium brasiliense]MDP9868727.1 putative flavoprotein involved in K+ transport [Streptosporangium brasiliense]